MKPQDKPPQALSTEELRGLLVEKQRSNRQLRMDYFQRTGRVVPVDAKTASKTYAPIEQDQYFNPADGRLKQAYPQTKKNRPKWFEKALYGIEIAAVIGLIGVVIFVFTRINALNTETALAIQQPTLAPTPLINAVVLPSGHTSPNSPGGAQPNDAEIPEHLRPLVQSIARIPLPTPGPDQAVRLQVPALSLDAPVIQGDGWDQLKKGVGQHAGSANPGQKGNVVLSAHDDVFGEIFRNLDHLQEGDKIILFSSQRAFTYVVRQSQIVEPTKVDVMNQTQDPIITLISCYPYLVDNKRIVVTAYLEQ